MRDLIWVQPYWWASKASETLLWVYKFEICDMCVYVHMDIREA